MAIWNNSKHNTTQELIMKTIVVGVTGGIAAYKACDIVSRLKKLNYNVKVIMTKNATEFVQPLTFEALSNNPVSTDTFASSSSSQIDHIELAKTADLLLIAPATANIIAKASHGIADDLLSTVILASKAPLFIAPAMNTVMLEATATQENIATLRRRGATIIDSEVGLLACKDIGAGKLRDTVEIVNIVHTFLSEPKPLHGKNILVTAGPTYEDIDPVRFLGNRSSGKMGYAIAEEAAKLGANVILVSGPTSLPDPKGVTTIRVRSAEQMFDAVTKQPYDVAYCAAAVADYTPASVADQKIKKANDRSLQLVRTKDILAHLGINKQDNQKLIGFAAETNNIEEYAMGKLARKNLDYIVANNVAQSGVGFAGDNNQVVVYNLNGIVWASEVMTKNEIAHNLLTKTI